jgi:hypothetical protein
LLIFAVHVWIFSGPGFIFLANIRSPCPLHISIDNVVVNKSHARCSDNKKSIYGIRWNRRTKFRASKIIQDSTDCMPLTFVSFIL